VEGFSNSIGMEFVKIPAGSFMMGKDIKECAKDDPKLSYDECMEGIYTDEAPAHKVTLEAFYMATKEVTRAQYEKVMELKPSIKRLADHPAVHISWDDAKHFVARLNRLEKTNKYALPSEAQWEYAARAGTTTEYSFGDDVDRLDEYGWYFANSDAQTHKVGLKKPNPWGLYDMHGNVYEWCEDWYVSDYNTAPRDGSANMRGARSHKVIRGGSWFFLPAALRSAKRNTGFTNYGNNNIGIRLIALP